MQLLASAEAAGIASRALLARDVDAWNEGMGTWLTASMPPMRPSEARGIDGGSPLRDPVSADP